MIADVESCTVRRLVQRCLSYYAKSGARLQEVGHSSGGEKQRSYIDATTINRKAS